jgi:colicin import membrane protein
MSLKRHKYAVDAQGFDEIKRIFNLTKENFYLGFCKCYFLTTPKPKRGRRSKVEIQQEFDILTQAESSEKTYSNPKEEELLRSQEQDLISSVKNVSSDEIIRKFADLNIEISKTIGSLSDKLVTEINYLTKLRQVAELEKKEIERLHKIDVAQTALDYLIEEYQTQQQELEEEITTGRADWEQEQAQKEAEINEEEATLEKTRKREIEEYEYKKNLERRKAQDKYEEEVRLSDKQNKEKQEALEKSWQQREAAIKSQEVKKKSYTPYAKLSMNRLPKCRMKLIKQ